MKVYAWLIDLIHPRRNCPTGMISGWVQKATEHRGTTRNDGLHYDCLKYAWNILKTEYFFVYVRSWIDSRSPRVGSSRRTRRNTCRWRRPPRPRWQRRGPHRVRRRAPPSLRWTTEKQKHFKIRNFIMRKNIQYQNSPNTTKAPPERKVQ